MIIAEREVRNLKGYYWLIPVFSEDPETNLRWRAEAQQVRIATETAENFFEEATVIFVDQLTPKWLAKCWGKGEFTKIPPSPKYLDEYWEKQEKFGKISPYSIKLKTKKEVLEELKSKGEVVFKSSGEKTTWNLIRNLIR